MITSSENLSLSLNLTKYRFNDSVQALWGQLRDTAVEAMQAPIPCLSAFGEECLFCAVVTKKIGTQVPSVEEDDMAMSMSIVVDEPVTFPDSDDPPEIAYEGEPVGLVYVTAAPAQSASREANIGIIIADSHQHKGFARETAELVLRWAFEELDFHRIQAAIMDTPLKDRAMRFFIGQGFTHEGTRRRSVQKRESAGAAGVWKDITYLAMLDTEWALRDLLRKKGPVPTLWDELFSRHAREREEMVKWDERHNRIRRVSSTETLRNGKAPQQSNIIDPWPSDIESSSSSRSYGSASPSPPPGAADISQDMLARYLELEEIPMEDTEAVSRQSSPSPYSFSFPMSPIPTIPPQSPSVVSSLSESEDEGGVSPTWRGLHGIPASASIQSGSGRLSWTERPLVPVRSGSVSESSESESWSDAVDGPDESDWELFSEADRT